MDLESVVTTLAPRLIAYALARTGRRDTAEDVAQDALTALVRRWRRAGSPRSPEAFVFSIAKRRATRANARRAFLAPVEAIRNHAHPGPTADQLFDDRRALVAVLSALRRLSRRDREALLLRAVGQLPFETVAQILTISPAAAKMRVSRARERLATLLQEPSHESAPRFAAR